MSTAPRRGRLSSPPDASIDPEGRVAEPCYAAWPASTRMLMRFSLSALAYAALLLTRRRTISRSSGGMPDDRGDGPLVPLEICRLFAIRASPGDRAVVNLAIVITWSDASAGSGTHQPVSAPPGAIIVRRRLGVSEEDRNPALDAGFSSTCRSHSASGRNANPLPSRSKDPPAFSGSSGRLTGARARQPASWQALPASAWRSAGPASSAAVPSRRRLSTGTAPH
jgi:hypothetical protein